MSDLKDRDLLDYTLIVWMGEFGRTPKINPANGRDHFPNAWSTVLAGGGIKGGQAIGKTSKDGETVEERPVTVRDFLATVCLALGIDPVKFNNSNVGRPIRIVDKGAAPINEIVGRDAVSFSPLEPRITRMPRIKCIRCVPLVALLLVLIGLAWTNAGELPKAVGSRFG